MQIENFAFDISTNKVTSLVVKGNKGMAQQVNRYFLNHLLSFHFSDPISREYG
jgi:hypothetical protein